MRVKSRFWILCLISFAFLATILAVRASVVGAEDAASCKVTYDSFGKAFLDKYCISCHHSSKKGEIEREGAPKSLNYDDLEVLKRTKTKMIDLASVKKKMPQNPPKPSDEERANFQKWLECEYK